METATQRATKWGHRFAVSRFTCDRTARIDAEWFARELREVMAEDMPLAIDVLEEMAAAVAFRSVEDWERIREGEGDRA